MQIYFKLNFFSNFIDDFDIGQSLVTFKSDYYAIHANAIKKKKETKEINFSKRRIIALKFRTRAPAAKRSGPSQRVRGSLDHKHLSCRRESILKSRTRLPFFEASNLLY